MTSLMHCAYRGNTEGCLQLLKRNANINLQQETDEVRELLAIALVTMVIITLHLPVHSTDVCHDSR